MREPTPPPAFGKFSAKVPVAAATKPVGSKRLENAAERMRSGLSSHGSLALKLYVVLWIVAVAAAAFVMMKA